jgi:hypothetical protein
MHCCEQPVGMTNDDVLLSDPLAPSARGAGGLLLGVLQWKRRVLLLSHHYQALRSSQAKQIGQWRTSAT